MTLSDRDLAFLADHHQAAMITVGDDGFPKAVRVAVVLIDGKLWSSGTEDRVRTKRLRADPCCTVFVFDSGYAWLSLETEVTILEGPDVPSESIRLFRLMQGQPSGPLSWFGREFSEDQFVQLMVDEHRVIYQFDVKRSYGMV